MAHRLLVVGPAGRARSHPHGRPRRCEEGEGTDERNASALAQGRTRTFAEVEGEVVRTREALLAAWASAPEGAKADEVFVWETIEHYEEHEPQLRAFLDTPGLSRRAQ